MRENSRIGKQPKGCGILLEERARWTNSIGHTIYSRFSEEEAVI
jgi:hypothetical protein